MFSFNSYDWKQAASIRIGEESVDVYENPDNQCAVLMDSVKGTPIASVSVVANQGRTLMAKRKGDSFLSIFEKDDQTFSFRISNMTNRQIFFVVRHGTDGKGKVVNRINLLDAKKTLVLSSDDSNEEREMRVQKQVNVESGKGVTVEQAEQTSTPGTYFSIGVVPTVDGEDWNKAVWMTTDYVCFPSVEWCGTGSWGKPVPAAALLSLGRIITPAAASGPTSFSFGEGKSSLPFVYPPSSSEVREAPPSSPPYSFGGFGSRPTPVAASDPVDLSFGGPPSPLDFLHLLPLSQTRMHLPPTCRMEMCKKSRHKKFKWMSSSKWLLR